MEILKLGLQVAAGGNALACKGTLHPALGYMTQSGIFFFGGGGSGRVRVRCFVVFISI